MTFAAEQRPEAAAAVADEQRRVAARGQDDRVVVDAVDVLAECRERERGLHAQVGDIGLLVGGELLGAREGRGPIGGELDVEHLVAVPDSDRGRAAAVVDVDRLHVLDDERRHPALRARLEAHAHVVGLEHDALGRGHAVDVVTVAEHDETLAAIAEDEEPRRLGQVEVGDLRQRQRRTPRAGHRRLDDPAAGPRRQLLRAARDDDRRDRAAPALRVGAVAEPVVDLLTAHVDDGHVQRQLVADADEVHAQVVVGGELDDGRALGGQPDRRQRAPEHVGRVGLGGVGRADHGDPVGRLVDRPIRPDAHEAVSLGRAAEELRREATDHVLGDVRVEHAVVDVAPRHGPARGEGCGDRGAVEAGGLEGEVLERDHERARRWCER